jgi:hypothetical protein
MTDKPRAMRRCDVCGLEFPATETVSAVAVREPVARLISTDHLLSHPRVRLVEIQGLQPELLPEINRRRG